MPSTTAELIIPLNAQEATDLHSITELDKYYQAIDQQPNFRVTEKISSQSRLPNTDSLENDDRIFGQLIRTAAP